MRHENWPGNSKNRDYSARTRVQIPQGAEIALHKESIIFKEATVGSFFDEAEMKVTNYNRVQVTCKILIMEGAKKGDNQFILIDEQGVAQWPIQEIPRAYEKAYIFLRMKFREHFCY